MFVSVETAIADLKAGKFVIVVDDDDRENEGDLVLAADCVTPQAVNFMATYGRGLVCVAMAGSMLDRLQLPLMVPERHNRSGFGTQFTVSVEARHGVTTGISAHDRSHTIRTLIDPRSTPEDIVMPGHVFPLRARDGGVLERRGQTEAGVDLTRLAGLSPAAVICEIMDDDGTMARLPSLITYAEQHALHIVSVDAIAQFRRQQRATNGAMAMNGNGNIYHDRSARSDVVARIGMSRLPTQYGEFTAIVYRDQQDREHMVLTMGTIAHGDAPLVRLHSECLTGDVLGSLRCDCGVQLHAALQYIAREGRGVLLYMRQEGRGIGLGNKIRAYALQDTGLDTVDANCQLGFPVDARNYAVAAALLGELGVMRLRLMTNNPAKISDLEGYGLHIVEQQLFTHTHAHVPAEAMQYLQIKARKMGHALLVHDE